MPDRIDSMLEALRGGDAGAPPERFMARVRSRGRRRRAGQAAFAAGLTLGGCALTLLLVEPPPAAPVHDPPTVFTLTRVNERSPFLALPEPEPAPAAEPLRVGGPVEPEWVERWVESGG